MLTFLLMMAFVAGGGSRSDIASLMVLRPAGVLILAYGLWGLGASDLRGYRFLLGMAAMSVGLVLAQLIPLPPPLWSQLPGRQLIVAIDYVASLGSVWRPLTLAPSGTWNALFSLVPTLAALVLAVQLREDERWALVPVVVGLGVVSAFLGILQIQGAPDGPLYFYQMTSNGSPVGLFANRNHHAVFLAALLPLLVVFASRDIPSSLDYRLRTMFAATFGLFIIPFILVIGSRIGLIAALVGLMSTPLLYRTRSSTGRKKRAIRRWIIFGVVVIGIALAVFTHIFGRALAFDRLIAQTSGPEIRYKAWQVVWDMIWFYFPTGTGFGSFAEVFRIHEPDKLLTTFNFNHAHNDWLELLLTGGLPAGLLLFVAVVALITKVIQLRRAPQDSNHMLASAGVWVLLLLGLGSLTDYPLRVPSIACLFSIALIWVSGTSLSEREQECV